MTNTAYPLISEYVRSALVSTSPGRGFTVEQRDKQEELRSQFPSAGSGLLLPFYTEQRDLTASGGGASALGKDIPEIGSALRDNLVLEKNGARVFGGLIGNTDLPRVATKITASWLSENAAGTSANELFATLSLRPKRVTAFIDCSKQLLTQSPMFERFLRQELMATLAVEIQRVAINGTGASNDPLGILGTSGVGAVVGGTNGAAPTYANLCDLEYAVTGTAKADRGNCAWILSPAVRRKLRQTFLNGTGSDPIWSASEAYNLLGHPAGVTPGSPDNLTKGTSSGNCSAIIFGEHSELMIGLWGPGIEVEVTTSTTYAKQGQVLVAATAYVDCGVRSPEAFAIMADALC